VRLVGILLFFAGGAALAYALRRTLESGRPKDVAFAALSFLAVIIALLGLGLTFVPSFLG
jgi:divalent metal cation (Fe/Co/Zn/Cd) transporter